MEATRYSHAADALVEILSTWRNYTNIWKKKNVSLPKNCLHNRKTEFKTPSFHSKNVCFFFWCWNSYGSTESDVRVCCCWLCANAINLLPSFSCWQRRARIHFRIVATDNNNRIHIRRCCVARVLFSLWPVLLCCYITRFLLYFLRWADVQIVCVAQQ